MSQEAEQCCEYCVRLKIARTAIVSCHLLTVWLMSECQPLLANT